MYKKGVFFFEGVEYRKYHKLSIIRIIFTSSMEYWGGNYTRERQLIV